MVQLDQNSRVEKTYLQHRMSNDALAMLGLYCLDALRCPECNPKECTNLCELGLFSDWCIERQYTNLVPITEITVEDLYEKDENGSPDFDYPSGYFLACLSDLGQFSYDILGVESKLLEWLDVIRQIWVRHGEWIYDEHTCTLVLITGGWSGNESIIRALSHTMFWMTKLDVIRAGGYYRFRLGLRTTNHAKPVCPLTIAIDFDGTIVSRSKFPDFGEVIPMAIQVIQELYYQGHTIIINTCRTGVHAIEAKVELDRLKIPYNFFNENSPERIERFGGDTRKISADIYIDDRNLDMAVNGVDWEEIRHMVNVVATRGV